MTAAGDPRRSTCHLREGEIIALTPTEDGLSPMVTDAFNLIGRGALGLLQAGDGDPTS